MTFYEGCTALITGASSGLGREFARQLAPHAGALVLVARRTDRMEDIKAALLRSNPSLSVYCYGLDLEDTDSIDRFTRWLSDEGIRVNFLVNNAGLGDHGPFEEAAWARVQAMLNVNITALTKLTHSLLPVMREFQTAAILNVSSTASFVPIPHLAVYAATKAYVTSFSEALRAELRGSGVSVTTLCPGPVDTEFSAIASRTGSAGDPVSAPAFLKVTPERAVYDALMAVARDRARVISGWTVFLFITLAASIPMFLLRLGLSARASSLGRERRTREEIASIEGVR